MNLSKWFLIAAAFITIVTAAGCVYTKKDVVQAPCILPTTISYTTHVLPILQTNCYSCHSANSNISGVLLDSYNSLRIYAQAGTLYGVISHSAGYSPMPDGGNKLDDCTIATIKKWIDSGSPNN